MHGRVNVKLRINGASSWFPLRGCIEMRGRQNMQFGTVKYLCGGT
jgi:hypothetical protein